MDPFVTGAFGITVLVLFLILKKAVQRISDVILFFAVLHDASSYGTRALKKPLKLHTYLARTTDLDSVSLEELYRFVIQFLAVPSMDKETILKNFAKTLESYSHVMLCRERSNGSLRGMMLIGIEHNGSYTLIKWGLVMFENYYRGGPWMYWILIYISLKELLLHPFTPLYHGGKIFSYKTYVMITPFEKFYPRYDQMTPAFEKTLIDHIATAAKQPTENYNQDTCVLEREYSFLREHIAPITDEELKNPHVKFFAEQNPGWKKGHCLIVLTLMTWREVFKAAFIAAKRSMLHSGTKSKKKAAKPALKRGLTYQSPGFSSCASIIQESGIASIDRDSYAISQEDEIEPEIL